MVRYAGESISDIGHDATSGPGANWSSQTTTYFHDGDAAQSGASANYGQSWMQTTVQGEGVISFYWKVSCQNGCDFLEFLVDGVRQGSLSGTGEWQKKAFTISGSGTHTLHWEYRKDSSSSYGSDCGWVDCVQWPATLTQWDTVSYVYDPGGRRIEKKYDGQAVMKYFYDGDHIIAEYDATGALVHKYVYGPGVDQPICMIDVADANATYYYHFDGLGSVIALTDSAGAVANLYEYSIFGEVSASDPNHPNRFLFTGREFDSETGLYYYRARYYNPYIGRFLQTDPAGQGMNPYAYCINNPVRLIDPSGLSSLAFYDARDTGDIDGDGRRDAGVATGRSFLNAANDHDYCFDMRPPDDIKKRWDDAAEKTGLKPKTPYEQEWMRRRLMAMKRDGVLEDVTDVYFYDHIGSAYSIYFGETEFEGEELEALMRMIGSFLPKGAKIHLRACWVAGGSEGEKWMASMAKASGHTVTGSTDATDYGFCISEEWPGTKERPQVPDYILKGDYVEVDPDGTVRRTPQAPFNDRIY